MKIKVNKNYLLGISIGIAVCIAAICLFALIMLVFKIDRAYSSFFGTISVSLGAFCSSFYIAGKTGSKGYLVGIITGLSFFAVITLLSFIITKSHIGSNTAFHFVIILLSSTVGGIIGVNKKKTKIL